MSQNGTTVKTTPYPYTSRTGAAVTKTRLDFADGSKVFRWPPGTKMADMLLYGAEDLPRLQPGEPLFFPEGEKNVDAISGCGLIAVTNAGGSGQTDFGISLEVLRLYADNPVVVLEDYDKSGEKLTGALLPALKSVHPQVRWTIPNAQQPGGDLADLLERLSPTERKSFVLALAKTAVSGPPREATQEPDEPRLVMTSLREGLATVEPPTRWVVDNLLNHGGTSCLSGPFKGGKSTLLRILCVCAASGIPFLGRETAPMNVGYISLEEGKAEVKEHFRLLAELSGDDCLDRIFYEVGDQWLPGKLEEKIDLIHGVVTEHDLGFLVLGPLQDFFAFRNINDYSEVKPILRGFTNKVARTSGCHVTFDHHNNKYGSGRAAFLGSVAVGAGVDQLLTLTVVEDDNSQVTGRGLTTWQRYGTSLLSLLGLDFLPNRLETSLGPPPEPLRDQAGMQQLAVKIAAVCHTWTETRTIEDEVGGNKQERLRALNWAHEQGMVIRRNRKGRGGGYEYLARQHATEDDLSGTSSGTSSEGNDE